MAETSDASAWRRFLHWSGLARPADGRPRSGLTRSRYGARVSPRLDEDLDELTRRLEALERRDA